MNDGQPAPWFVIGTVLSKEWYTQYGHGFNYNYNYNKWYLISTATFKGHFVGKRPILSCLVTNQHKQYDGIWSLCKTRRFGSNL